MIYLNVDVLFVRILNEEGKCILPHRAVGPITSLRKKKENVYYADSLIDVTMKMFFSYLAFFCCVLNRNLHHWTWVLISFSHL